MDIEFKIIVDETDYEFAERPYQLLSKLITRLNFLTDKSIIYSLCSDCYHSKDATSINIMRGIEVDINLLFRLQNKLMELDGSTTVENIVSVSSINIGFINLMTNIYNIHRDYTGVGHPAYYAGPPLSLSSDHTPNIGIYYNRDEFEQMIEKIAKLNMLWLKEMMNRIGGN